MSLSATILAFLPSFVQQVKSPSNLGFLYSLMNSSFSFYLFSYQGMLYCKLASFFLCCKYINFVFPFVFCVQFMRNQFCFLFYLQVFQHGKNLGCMDGLCTLPFSQCTHLSAVTSFFYSMQLFLVYSFLYTTHLAGAMERDQTFHAGQSQFLACHFYAHFYFTLPTCKQSLPRGIPSSLMH